MNDHFDKLNKATATKLSESERGTMRSEFHAYLDAHPAKGRAIPSPYQTFLQHGVAWAFALFLVVSVPVGFAAENSLPNDALYSVKTRVFEPVALGIASASSDEAEAETRTALIERRLGEAEALIASDSYDETDLEVLGDAIQVHAAAIHDIVRDTSTSGDTDGALDTGLDLENTLDAHEEILTLVADEDVTSDVSSLIQEIGALGDSTDTLQETVSEALVEEPDGGALRADAQTAIDTLIEALKSADTSEEFSESAHEFLRAAEEALLEADATEGDIALEHIEEAHENAEQGLVIIEAGNRLQDR